MDNDRVNYTFGFKKNLGNYETVNISVSFSSDVKKGETPEKTMGRVIKFVENEADKKFEELNGKTKKEKKVRKKKKKRRKEREIP